MKAFMIATSLSVAALAALPVAAQDAGAPASPSGAPEAAAKSGSSTAGTAASANEMKSHGKNVRSQKHMANPHKKGM